MTFIRSFLINVDCISYSLFPVWWIGKSLVKISWVTTFWLNVFYSTKHKKQKDKLCSCMCSKLQMTDTECLVDVTIFTFVIVSDFYLQGLVGPQAQPVVHWVRGRCVCQKLPAGRVECVLVSPSHSSWDLCPLILAVDILNFALFWLVALPFMSFSDSPSSHNSLTFFFTLTLYKLYYV